MERSWFRPLAACTVLLLALSACGGGYSGYYSDHPKPGTVPKLAPATTPYPAVKQDGVWRMPGGDQFQSRHVAAAGPAAPQLKWEFSGEGTPLGAPCQGEDGAIYCLTDTCLLRFGADGRIAQRYALPEPCASRVFGPAPPPFLLTLEWLCYSGGSGIVHLLDLAGNELWSYASASVPVNISTFDGTQILLCFDGSLQRQPILLDAAGTELWRSGPGYWSLPGPGGLVVTVPFVDKLQGWRNGALVWELTFDGDRLHRPFVASNGNIYIGAVQRDVPADLARVLLISPDGKLLHTTELNGSLGAYGPMNLDWAVEGTGGTVYCSDENGHVYALASDGAVTWMAILEFQGMAQLCPTADGALYSAFRYLGEQNRLARLDSAGQVKWTSQLEYIPEGMAAAHGGGVIYTGGLALTSVDRAGRELWRYLCLGSHLEPPVFDEAGNAYASVYGGIISLAPDGSERWRKTDLPDHWGGTLVLSPANGMLYSFSSQTICIGTGGDTIWAKRLEYIDESSAPVIGADGSLVLLGGSYDSQVLCYGAEGDLVWTYTDFNQPVYPPAIDRQGNIYFISNDYEFYGDSPDVSVWRPEGRWLRGWLRCLGRNGALLWSAPLGAEPTAGPVVDPAGNILVVDMAGKLEAYGARGERRYEAQAGLASDYYSLALGAGGDVLALRAYAEADYNANPRFIGTALSALGGSGGALRWTVASALKTGLQLACDGGGTAYSYLERSGEAVTLARISPQGALEEFAGTGAIPGDVSNTHQPVLSPGGMLIVSAGGRLQAYGD